MPQSHLFQSIAYYVLFARVWLETNIGSAAPAAVLVGLVFLSQYLVRRFIPGVWEWIANFPFPGGVHKPAVVLGRKAWQALPSAATGAFLASLAYGGNSTAEVIGAIVALFAPVVHEVAKALPIPYQGGRPPAAGPHWQDVTPTEPAIARRKSDPPPPDTLR